ncbi:MAG TPA: hypothetical protein VH328_15405 [Burkholderiaceae bacterium]|jgi:hypothetical protein|nr:hypothetical protein [Burkholderiaceae bacterium]
MSDEPKRQDPALDARQQDVLQSLRGAVKLAPVPVRSCGECAKCCEGWLSGTVYGHAFSPGRPCFFLEKTCSIYPDRPLDPCRNYRCAWLAEEIFPMWMKPSLANVILTKREDAQSKAAYYIADQAGDTFDVRALQWLLDWAKESGANLEYRLNGEVKRLGAPEFVNG